MHRRKDTGALSDGIWQDREIQFDVEPRLLRLIPGEYLVERIDNVEDTKGNNGDRGTLRITNIRLIWNAISMPRINLSIGYNTIHGVTTRILKSTKLFTTVIGIHRAFETTKLYREVKMRGALVDEQENLRILPLEHQTDRLDGVWNLSTDQGSLGVIILTNVRVVWYAVMNPLYNCSVPYIQIKTCRVRDSKFGPALVLETSVQSGEYVLGFRLLPEERLHMLARAVQSFHTACMSSPIFGVQYSKDRTGAGLVSIEELEERPVQDDVVIDSKPMRVDAFAAYFSDNSGTTEHRPIVYSEELGVAVECLKPGFTISDLWAISLD